MKPIQTQVLIIGGGATGTGIARDLALRGVHCVLAEKYDINAGASGRNHGLLHSGARYVFKDAQSARECKMEGDILKRYAPHCIENTGGIFMAVAGDDEDYITQFPELCAQAGLPCRALDVKEALEMEPRLSDKIIAAYEVEDATIDPFQLSLENISHAQELGATLLRYTKITGFKNENNRIVSINTINTQTGEEITIEADQIINATGAWAAQIAAMANCSINIIYSKGTLLVTQNRLTHQVINRLRPPGDADILVPGGTVSILGTTSINVDSLEDIRPTVKEVDYIINEGAPMVPSLDSVRYTRAFSGIRPLIGSDDADDGRSVSRQFALIDHSKDGVNNFTTISGGKLTTYRYMAEKTVDLICQRLGVTAPCLTKDDDLPADRDIQWTEPGISPRTWLKTHARDDVLLCECEMVPKSAIDSIIKEVKKHNNTPDLIAIGLRSRVGKGSCQGSFCSSRIIGYLYQQELLQNDEGLSSLKDFLNERWKGQRAIIWGDQLAQSELLEAMQCGFLNLEQ